VSLVKSLPAITAMDNTIIGAIDYRGSIPLMAHQLCPQSGIYIYCPILWPVCTTMCGQHRARGARHTALSRPSTDLYSIRYRRPTYPAAIIHPPQILFAVRLPVGTMRWNGSRTAAGGSNDKCMIAGRGRTTGAGVCLELASDVPAMACSIRQFDNLCGYDISVRVCDVPMQ
jgi:hypothetical protein